MLLWNTCTLPRIWTTGCTSSEFVSNREVLLNQNSSTNAFFVISYWCKYFACVADPKLASLTLDVIIFVSPERISWPFELLIDSIWVQLKIVTVSLTLIREFLRPSPSALSGKKSKKIACDVTVGTRKIKLYVQIQCQMGYLTVQISNGISKYRWTYAVLNVWDCWLWNPSKNFITPIYAWKICIEWINPEVQLELKSDFKQSEIIL